MLQSDWLQYLHAISTMQPKFFPKKESMPVIKQCNLLLVFRNNFEEITNTSLFLLKQLDYILALNFYEVIVNSGFALVNNHVKEISSS